MTRRIKRMMSLFFITALISACTPTFGAIPAPTFDPNSLSTVIAETANAAFTQTALFTTPSATPTATTTFTPTLTETPTAVPTILIQLMTPIAPTAVPQVANSNRKFSCAVVSKTPEDGFGFSANIEFTVIWLVLNNGLEVWDANSADIRYLSGKQMHTQSVYDLDNNVAPGEQYTVTVNMKAPGESGTYTTTWVIKTKVDEYCRMSITIKV